jgi:hypothetical protein
MFRSTFTTIFRGPKSSTLCRFKYWCELVFLNCVKLCISWSKRNNPNNMHGATIKKISLAVVVSSLVMPTSHGRLASARGRHFFFCLNFTVLRISLPATHTEHRPCNGCINAKYIFIASTLSTAQIF